MDGYILGSTVTGALVKWVIDGVFTAFGEKDLTKKEKQLLTLVICLFFGALVSVGQSLLTTDYTITDLVQNIFTVLTTSQLIHNIVRSNT